MNRFFLDSGCFRDTEVVIDSPSVIHQMQNVLRMRSGEKFIALDNTGMEFLCAIMEITGHSAKARIIEKQVNTNETSLRLVLFQSMPKKMELFEWVLQKGTEIGVSAFVPLITSRTERKRIGKVDRLKRILREASEQSERGRIPELRNPTGFDRALSEDASETKILLHSRGEFPLLSKEHSKLKNAKTISIFIGPEGGFSDEEVKFAEQSGLSIMSLGPRVLRTETAGIAAASLILL